MTCSPTIYPERLQPLCQEMVIEAGANLVFHSWAAQPIVENRTATGATRESKEDRMAIITKVVVDATGDGDLFSRASAALDDDIEANDIHRRENLVAFQRHGHGELDRLSDQSG